MPDNTLTAPSTPTNLSRRLETQDSENDTDQDIKNFTVSIHHIQYCIMYMYYFTINLYREYILSEEIKQF